jgi:hypothetical protein
VLSERPVFEPIFDFREETHYLIYGFFCACFRGAKAEQRPHGKPARGFWPRVQSVTFYALQVPVYSSHFNELRWVLSKIDYEFGLEYLST